MHVCFDYMCNVYGCVHYILILTLIEHNKKMKQCMYVDKNGMKKNSSER